MFLFALAAAVAVAPPAADPAVAEITRLEQHGVRHSSRVTSRSSSALLRPNIAWSLPGPTVNTASRGAPSG